MSVLIAVLSALGGGGILAGLIRLVVMLVQERRLSRVTNKCLEAKGKAEREYYHSLLRTLKESGDQDLGIEAMAQAVPQPRGSGRKQPSAGRRALPVEVKSDADSPETSTAA